MSEDRKLSLANFWQVLKKSGKKWSDINPWRQSAIISYFSIFSLPALLMIVIYIAGYFMGEESVSDELYAEIASILGKDAASFIDNLVAGVAEQGTSTVAFIFGLAFAIFGATTVFYHLQISLNRIWGVVPKPEKAILKYIKDRVFSFGMIVSIGFLLLLSLVLNSLLAMLSSSISRYWPDALTWIMAAVGFLLNIMVVSLLFALMFKILPDAIIRWRSVWVGAVLTALLFGLGQFGLSLYFQVADPASLYGAAASAILLLIWVTYVSMIVLFGAAFTRQWAVQFGHGIRPTASAELVDFDYKKYQDPFE
jgi:membrane protein